MHAKARSDDNEHAIAYGINDPQVWITVRGRQPNPGYGHVAISAGGKAAVDAAYTAGISLLMLVLVKYCWPSHLEEANEPPGT